MPTNTINIDRSVRMRYFNGLFLQEREFNAEQDFYIGIRRYLNYLLFDPGRLYIDDAVAPLQVAIAGMQVSVTPGSALIRDSATMSGYELEIPNLPVTDRQFDLSGAALSHGDALTVTLQREESSFISTGGGGAGVSPSENDRTVERAILSVNLPSDPAPTPPFITLATIDATASGGVGAADTLSEINTTERGGIRLAILSKDVRDMLGGAGPGTSVLTSIVISPAGPVSIVNGSTQTFTATGHFDDGSSHALTAGEGLGWGSSDTSVATVHPTNGTVSGVGVGGPVNITATVGAHSGTRVVNVVPVVVPINVSSFNPTFVGSGQVNFTITGSGMFDVAESVGADITSSTRVRFLDGPDFTGGVETFLSESPLVTVVSNGVIQVLNATIPVSAEWPSSGVRRVVPRVVFGGGAAQRPGSDVSTNQLRVNVL